VVRKRKGKELTVVTYLENWNAPWKKEFCTTLTQEVSRGKPYYYEEPVYKRGKH